MWKEILPDNCPPSSAHELDVVIFRILKDNEPSEADFINYSKLYPNNPRYRNLCKAYAISFYDSESNLLSAYKMSVEKGNVIGTHLAQYLLKKEHGRAEYKTVNGHYSVWFYQGWNFNDFEAVIVKPINAN